LYGYLNYLFLLHVGKPITIYDAILDKKLFWCNLEGNTVILKQGISVKIAACVALFTLSFSARSDNIKNTNIPTDDGTPEAFVALGGFYKALDILEKEKSYGDKYANMLEEIRTSTYLDAENQHPYIELAGNSLNNIHKIIHESAKIIPKEDVVGMIKKALDDRYALFSAAKKEGKIKNS